MASNNTISNFKRANHSEKVLNILKVYLQRSDMCDIVIIAGIDGVRVPAHRILLSACSLYFLNLFTSPSHPHEQNEVTVANVSGSILRALIDYCYCGALEIRKDNVKTLLAAAYILLMDDVSKTCQEYFVDTLDASNSLEVAQIAESYSFKDVQRKAEAFTHKHYMDVCKTPEFMRLSIEQLSKLIASEDLIVNSEEDVFNSCVSWVSDDPVNREMYSKQWLALVRFPLLSPHFITKNVKPHSLCKSSECIELIYEAMAWHLTTTQYPLNSQPRIEHSTTRMPDQTFPITYATANITHHHTDITHHHTRSSSSDEILLAITRDNRNKVGVHSYCSTANEWTDCKIELGNLDWYVCAVLGDSLLIVEEDNCASPPRTVKSYNFKSKTLTTQPPPKTSSVEMGCAVLNGYFYIVGGHNVRNALNTVERWDPKFQTWTYVAAMSEHRRGLGVAVLGKYLYAVGGDSGMTEDASVIKNSVERYDPITNKWTSMAPMITNRFKPGVAASNGYLYAVGGMTAKGFATPLMANPFPYNHFNGAPLISQPPAYTSTVERFDPVANKWTMIYDISSARFNISCAFLGGRVMAVGGESGYSCQSTVDEYNVETNKWTLKKPLSSNVGLTRLVKIPAIYFP